MVAFSTRRALAPAVLCFLLSACGGSETEADAALDADALENIAAQATQAVCSDSPPGFARCHSFILTGSVAPDATGKPKGLGAADLASAYNLPKTGSSATVAIVDAYDDPNAEADLAVYRKQYGLPACTSKSGCFKKVGQSGGATLPKADAGWAQEIALDLDMASAACPSCKILLVEASSPSMADLGAAINTAARLGAAVVSNSWGGAETSSEPSFDTKYLKHGGVLITASSGDDGYGVEFPAASQYVLAVGGTRLAKSSASRGWSERAWTKGGSGCSQYEAKPSWQTDASCKKRMVADVSAVADPDTGVAVYVTYGDSKGWGVFGGTSAASPLVAGIFAFTGTAAQGPGFAYAHPKAFFDAKTGSNGSCTTSYFCAGKTGYDGPTGLGTPNAKELVSAK
jgi:subtilase family serine protease